jgi:sn-glycerol 3-phosphate transport system substrate-binding protein
MSTDDGKIVIDVWIGAHPFPGYVDPVSAMADAFNEVHPEYHVNVEGHDFQAIPEEVVHAVEAGNPPHLAEYYYTSTQTARDTLAADGTPLFASVEQAIGGRPEILGEPVLIDAILPAVRGYYTHRGDLTSMPASATTILLYTNTSLLRAAGLTEPPRTWDEVEAACKAVANLPGRTTPSITWPDHGWFFQQALAQQGALLADQDNGHAGRATRIDLASDAMLAYAGWWQRLHAEGHYHYGGTQEDWFACLDAFAAQESAFLLCTSAMTTPICMMGGEAGFEVAVSRLPHNGNAPHAGEMVSGQSLWLRAGLDDATRDGALAFTQFMINAENAAFWHKANGFVPITHASYEALEEEGWFAEFPQHRVATEQLVAADGSPAVLGAQLGDFADIQSHLTQAMEDVMLRGADLRARFRQATVDAQALLDAYNEHCAGGPAPRTPVKLRVS